MKSLAHLPEKMPSPAAAADMPEDPQPSFPGITLNSKQAGEAGITGETVGDTITLKVKCKVTRVGDYGSPKEGEQPPISLDITHAEIVPNDDEGDDEEAPEQPEEEETEIQNTRPKPRVLGPESLGDEEE